MVIITNHRVQDNDISDGQTVDELEEFQTEHTRIGIPRIPDAGTSPPLAIIEKVNLWIHNIREKKSSKDDDRRESQQLEKKFKAIVIHRNSDEYIMKQLVVLDRAESVINQVGSKSTLGQTLRHIRGKREQLMKKYGVNELFMKKLNLKECVTRNEDIGYSDKFVCDEEVQEVKEFNAEQLDSMNASSVSTLFLSNAKFDKPNKCNQCSNIIYVIKRIQYSAKVRNIDLHAHVPIQR